MRLFTGLSLPIVAGILGTTACTAERGDDFVYYRTVPMTAAGADSLGAVLLAQRLGVSHVAAVGPEVGAAPRKGIVAFETGSTNRATHQRVIAWLRGRPEVVTAGLDKETIWAAPNDSHR